MGLGLHGGGIATVKWFAGHGARVTATDMCPREVLLPSLKALKGVPAHYVLGRHRAGDFRTHDLVVVNPAVPKESPYLAIARDAGKGIVNDASLFFDHCNNPVIAVTGTRGKTTTTLWIAELLKKRSPSVRPSGNTPDNALLKEFDRVSGRNIPVVCELSSWQLEYLPQATRAPKVALITNLYPDHLNRYDGEIAAYAAAKANIFAGQDPSDALILNRDSKWWKYFAQRAPRGRVYYTSAKPLPHGVEGIFVRGGKAVLRKDGTEHHLCSIAEFKARRGAHNVMNLLQAALAALLFDPKTRITERDIRRFPSAPMRQENITPQIFKHIGFRKRFGRRPRVTVINDSCATSPDGAIAAIRRFAEKSEVILITGGTDKALEFGDLAKEIAKDVPPERLILLEGSATARIAAALTMRKYRVPEPKETLAECVDAAIAAARKTKRTATILFSPGAASFEKFLHEFDRGEKFNALVRKALR